MKYRKAYLPIVISLFLIMKAPCTYSQNAVNCATAIKDAEELYKQGNYDQVIQLLNATICDCKLSKREKEDAYLTLAQAYLEKEKYDQANNLFIKLLNNDPNFKLKENIYQEDFYTYYNKIKIRPMLSAGVKLGVNTQQYKTKNVYQISQTSNYSSAYIAQPGYSYGAFAEWRFYDNLSAVAEGGFSKMGYDRTIKGNDVNKAIITYSEVLKSFETSLYIKKYFLHKQLKPFVFLGGYYTHLNKATGNIELTYKLKDNITPDVDDYYLNKSNINMLNMRNASRQGLVGGFGISYKTKNILIAADASYRSDIGKHLTNSDNRYKNEDLLFKYYYIDNDVILSRVDISVSVAYIFKYSVKSK